MQAIQINSMSQTVYFPLGFSNVYKKTKYFFLHIFNPKNIVKLLFKQNLLKNLTYTREQFGEIY